MTARLRIGACLSISGRFAQFGQQAARGLEAWASLAGGATLIIEDDRSDKAVLREVLPRVAARCDLLLGPYSTILMRAAGDIAAQSGALIWNHGGSGDDVESAHPGHAVSVLTPTSRYAEPFLRRIASEGETRDLVIVHGAGSFGRQVANGADNMARQFRIRTRLTEAGSPLPPASTSAEWDLLSAGVFEQDAELVSSALRLPEPPRRVCAVAAGVREFGNVVDDPEGVFGIAQWFPGACHDPQLGPAEDEFLRAYSGLAPDYPAVQAAAAAILATRCATLAGNTSRADLWEAAAALDTSTMFGGFRIDPASGLQVRHQTVLVRWARGKLSMVDLAAEAL